MNDENPVIFQEDETRLIKTAEIWRNLRSSLPDNWVVELDNLVPSLQHARFGIRTGIRGYGFDFYLRYYFHNQMYRIGRNKTSTILATTEFAEILKFVTLN